MKEASDGGDGDDSSIIDMKEWTGDGEFGDGEGGSGRRGMNNSFRENFLMEPYDPS